MLQAKTGLLLSPADYISCVFVLCLFYALPVGQNPWAYLIGYQLRAILRNGNKRQCQKVNSQWKWLQIIVVDCVMGKWEIMLNGSTGVKADCAFFYLDSDRRGNILLFFIQDKP